jgi:transcriptional regulator with XRE-family HTH domain
MVDMNFGRRLRQLREAEGWTQQELADAAGLHRFAVAKLEQGLREPSWSTLLALAAALALPLCAFGGPPHPAEEEGQQPAGQEERPGGRPNAGG